MEKTETEMLDEIVEALKDSEPMHITKCDNYETCDYCNPSIEPDFNDDDDDEVIAKPKPKNYTYNDGGKSLTGRKGTSGDCGVRAMAIALDLDYDYCYKVLAQANKDAGYTKSAREGVHKKEFVKVLKEHGWAWTSAPKNLWVWDEDNYMYLNRKARHKDMPKNKTIIASMAKHFVAIIDQEIHDIFDSSYKMVYGYWEKK
mgnify:CR=1 FL=1